VYANGTNCTTPTELTKDTHYLVSPATGTFNLTTAGYDSLAGGNGYVCAVYNYQSTQYVDSGIARVVLDLLPLLVVVVLLLIIAAMI
jgi:hypothetical protein